MYVALQERRAHRAWPRPAQMGDLVKVYVRGERLHPADEHIEHEAAQPEEEGHEEHKDTFIDQDVNVVLSEDADEESVIPGFSANLVGLSAGEKKSFSLAFPEDYTDQALARHSFNFDVEMKEVQSRTARLNDDLPVSRMNDNLLDLRIRARIW
jgi:FKBP-type peptidyl-prolyl cis-trans isomerase (trigger factor)